MTFKDNRARPRMNPAGARVVHVSLGKDVRLGNTGVNITAGDQTIRIRSRLQLLQLLKDLITASTAWRREEVGY